MRHDFEKLEVYQRSLLLAAEVVKLSAGVRPFKFADQLAKSAVSIPSNIAEGADRKSNKDFIRFLNYSSGSTAELITQLRILKITHPEKQAVSDKLIIESKEINAMIQGFILKIQQYV